MKAWVAETDTSGLAMRAVVLREFGDPQVLALTTVPVPSIGPEGLLVRVRACGVCGHDLLARRGRLHTTLPMVLGHEIAGVVAAVGAEVRGFPVGSRVALIQRIPCGHCPRCRAGATNLCRQGPGFYGEDLPGGYADYVVASPLNAVLLPDEVGDQAAAILSCGVGTGYRALRASGVQAGDVLVVTGAGGGVGVHAVQIAAALGARTLAVTTSEGKREGLLTAGAEDVLVLDGDTTIREVLRYRFDADGADAVIEIAGPPTFEQSLAAVRAGGKLVLVGNTEPRPVPINPGLLIVKELSIIGSAHATRGDLDAVVSLVADGTLRPLIGQVRPLSEAAELHRALEAREVIGRGVLLTDEAA